MEKRQGRTNGSKTNRTNVQINQKVNEFQKHYRERRSWKKRSTDGVLKRVQTIVKVNGIGDGGGTHERRPNRVPFPRA